MLVFTIFFIVFSAVSKFTGDSFWKWNSSTRLNFFMRQNEKGNMTTRTTNMFKQYTNPECHSGSTFQRKIKLISRKIRLEFNEKINTVWCGSINPIILCRKSFYQRFNNGQNCECFASILLWNQLGNHWSYGNESAEVEHVQDTNGV